jgi:hypothetical protein
VIRLRNRWVPMDPRGWTAEMDLSISVGLGIGNKAEQVAQAETVLTAMDRLAATRFGWMVRPEHVHAAIVRLFNAAGIRNVDDYLGDPRQPPSEGAGADADTQLNAAGLAARRQEVAARIEIAREESAIRLQLMREAAAAKRLAAREKAALETQLAREKMAIEAALERERLDLSARRRGAADIDANRPGGDLDK